MFQGLELYQKLTPLQFFFNDFYLVTGAEKLYCKTNFGTVYVAWITFHWLQKLIAQYERYMMMINYGNHN